MEVSEESLQEPVRLDVWLWAVRLFKTRSDAAEACRNARVKIGDKKCKPSRKVRSGDRLTVSGRFLTRDIEVKSTLSRRVGAIMVPEYLIDHTTEAARQEADLQAKRNREGSLDRAHGSGRPTKKERRDLDELMEEAAQERDAFEKFVRSMTKKD